MGRFHGSSCASSTREDAVLRKDNGDFKKAFRPASEFSTLDFKPETSGDDALSEIRGSGCCINLHPRAVVVGLVRDEVCARCMCVRWV